MLIFSFSIFQFIFRDKFLLSNLAMHLPISPFFFFFFFRLKKKQYCLISLYCRCVLRANFDCRRLEFHRLIRAGKFFVMDETCCREKNSEPTYWKIFGVQIKITFLQFLNQQIFQGDRIKRSFFYNYKKLCHLFINTNSHL